MMFSYCYDFSESRTNNAVLKAEIAEIKKFAIDIKSQKNNAPNFLSHQISHSDK